MTVKFHAAYCLVCVYLLAVCSSVEAFIAGALLFFSIDVSALPNDIDKGFGCLL